MKNIRSFILLLSLCITTPALSHVRVVVEERSSFWGWPWWDTPSYTTTTYAVCGSCHHSRCCCSHDHFLNSTEGIIATFIVSAVALAIRLLQENNQPAKHPRTERIIKETVHVRTY